MFFWKEVVLLQSGQRQEEFCLKLNVCSGTCNLNLFLILILIILHTLSLWLFDWFTLYRFLYCHTPLLSFLLSLYFNTFQFLFSIVAYLFNFNSILILNSISISILISILNISISISIINFNFNVVKVSLSNLYTLRRMDSSEKY